MHSALVNGWTGEGMTMSVVERKKSAEEWWKATQKYGMKMILFIGGMSLAHINELVSRSALMNENSLKTSFYWNKMRIAEFKLIFNNFTLGCTC